ncbi:LysR family transcriptional regulator [Aurantimicrobium sp. MWH-Uga1]|uniref:LysR family transcriptional regulator n=1 Tax=Aurantimicrobium sp. MWH-Uga1 TaxID=2079575 RepID=UPI000DED916A|nr:LysR family transcriptional regulator [Aurantimicrobium sp. MWH-Uga1]AXE54212.1 HTH-type transcriptional regulator GltC [Aurantimicrobium sp. MWH-Uga1]
MLDLRRLRLLREVKLRGTLAEVAEALNYSPSAVSQQLALLEKEVGVPLLRKSGRRVSLTPQAEILVAHTSTVLEVLEQAEAEVTTSLERPAGIVRLAVFQSAALALLPDALTLVRQEYPEMRLEVTQQEPEAALHATWTRDFDLVIAEQYPGHAAPRHPELDRVDLTTDPIRLGVSRKLVDEYHIKNLADTAGLPWVMEPRGTASRHWAEQACRQAGFEPDVQFETADIQAHIRLVESGNAVALLTGLAWVGRKVTVDLIDLPGNPRRTVFTAARRASVGSPAIQVCRDVLSRTAELVNPAAR